VTTSAATGQEALGWADLAPLQSALSDPDGGVRAAAAEAAGRLPLTPAAWDRVGNVLSELLASPSLGTARTAAHAPLARLRQELRTIAADGGHPGQRVASAALAEVGDDSVLATEVSRLLARPLTDRTAARLAALPLERLPVTSARLPALPSDVAEYAARSWWTAVAAARRFDTDGLDDWLARVLQDPDAWPLANGSGMRLALRAVAPLPQFLIWHLDRRLSVGSAVHDQLRSAWLEPAPVAATPQRLDDFADALTGFVQTIRTGSAAGAGADPAAHAGVDLAADAAALPAGTAPDPTEVYTAWLGVAERAGTARPYIAWTLARAGAANLVSAVAGSGNDGYRASIDACLMIRDAAAWLNTPEPPGVPAGTPPWPAPTGLIGSPRTRSEDSAGAPPDAGAPGWDADLSFDVDVDFEPEGLVPEESPAPSSAYARLACPPAVVVEEEFDLELGLADRPTSGVLSQSMTLPDRPAYTLTVQVIMDGFTLREGEAPTVELLVTPDEPYPRTVLHLTATSTPALDSVRQLLAVFSVDGTTVGSATRVVMVVASLKDLPGKAGETVATGIDTALPSATAKTADLTITISKGDDIEGRRLLWSYQSPYESVPASTEPLVCTLGSRPDDFARKLMRSLGAKQGPLLEPLIKGKAKLIGEVIPAPVHDAIRATAAAVGGPPTVLLLSADPYVPWELAHVENPWLPGAPAILGAQAVVGRWALNASGPTSEPARQVSMRTMSVIRGLYQGVIGFNPLKHAEQEALDLEAAYGAVIVDARVASLVACLEGEPPAQVLHFAIHGKYDPTGVQDGLILVDGAVEPDVIVGFDLTHQPFVFLNACQVGMAGETLGQYGGMAQAFVEAGASAVIAPLWNVKDDVAREISLRFYQAVFAGTSPAEFLRTERAQPSESGTNLAYVLYGHPLLQLNRSKEADGDGHPVEP
jgi:CHAT domain